MIYPEYQSRSFPAAKVKILFIRMNSFEFFCNFALSSWLWIMKRIILFCCIVCIAIGGYARHDVIYICQGEVYYWDISEYATPSDTLVYASGPIDWAFFYQEAQYDTVIGNIVSLSPSSDRAYKLISINGCDSVISDCPVYVTLHVKTAPTITIDSIKHVTCPDGDFYPYMDGSFHVSLDDSVQNYAWIEIEVNTPFFFVHMAYDSVTLPSLRAGTYYVVAYGTNGCEYHDSVSIEQPEPWGWDPTLRRIDTVCPGDTGSIVIDVIGGTPPYDFTWFYFEDTPNGVDTVFMEDSTRVISGIYSGIFYFVLMYDSHECKAFGSEIESIVWYLYEWAEDTTHIITTDNIACYGGEFMVQAQSIGEGTYTWHVGDLSDSTNYSTWIDTDSVYMAEYLTPPMIESAWVSVDFYDQHNCVTHDSVWVEVYNPDVSMTIQTSEIFADSTFVVYVSPPGGDLYIDDALLISNIPSVFTVYTDGISVGPHVLKYAGTFGGSMGLSCEDEESISIQVETNPFVPDWEYEISIYPNPVTTTLNLSSTGMSDFKLSILDITGKVIKTERMLDQTFAFDVSGLASGMYMLRLVSHDGASKVVKFVKR